MATIEQLNNIKQIIEGVDGFSIRTSTPSKIVVDCDKDRQEAKTLLESTFKDNDIKFKEQIVSGSSFPATVIDGQEQTWWRDARNNTKFFDHRTVSLYCILDKD
jgi:hypothetical protein